MQFSSGESPGPQVLSPSGEEIEISGTCSYARSSMKSINAQEKQIVLLADTLRVSKDFTSVCEEEQD